MLLQSFATKPARKSTGGVGAERCLLAVAPSVGRSLAVVLLALLNSCATNQSTAPRSAEVIPEIRSALSEPSRPPVPSLPPDVARELLPPPELSLSRLTNAPAEPRFDLNVVQLPASQVFAALAKDTRYSMVIDPELKTPITVTLKDVSLVEALETLREAYGIEYKILGTRIFVQAAGLETRVFTVNYPTESRTGRSEVHVTSGSITQAMGNGTPGAPGSSAPPSSIPSPGGPGTPGVPSATESTRITTQIRSDLWAEIEASLKLLVPVNPERKDGTQLIVSPQSGVIVVRALPRQLRQVEHYLRSMRLSIERQIVLEAKIIEVTLNDSSQTGINWAAFHNGAGARSAGGMLTPGATLSPTGAISDSLLTATPGAALAQSGTSASPLFGLAFQTNNFAGLLEFLQTQGELQVISSPRITAMNNQQAVLKVGTDDFFVTGVTTNIATGTGSSAVITPTITVEPFFSGVSFDITPSIDEDASIILHVHPSVSAVAEKDKIVNLGTLGSYTLPLASSTVSETDTVVRGHDGNIVAIGGLMTVNSNDTSSGLPGLGTVPGLGYLFSSKQKSRTKTELVILIKPTVVHSDAQLQAEREDFQRRLEGDLSTHVH